MAMIFMAGFIVRRIHAVHYVHSLGWFLRQKGEQSMKLTTIALAAGMGAAVGIQAPAFAADIVIGVPNWPSVAATANVLKVVIEDNLGLEVELQNGTNPIVFEAMDKGSMHAHPEVWMPNQQNLSS
jgi:ABC-type proline/glycine betaine transport system substrate-binding protein